MQEILSEYVRATPGLELAEITDTQEDALAAAERQGPALVILDLILRVGKGLDVLREIKSRVPGCRVLVFTGHDAEQYRARCLAEGADHFLSKNRDPAELIQLLRQIGNGSVPREAPRGSAQSNPTS